MQQADEQAHSLGAAIELLTVAVPLTQELVKHMLETEDLGLVLC